MKTPPLPPFIAPASRIRKLRQAAQQHGTVSRLIFSWERDNGCSQRFELPVPEGQENDPGVQLLAERCVKFVLWASGGWRLRLAGPDALCRAIETAYAPNGPREFDRRLMGRVYGQTLSVLRCPPQEIPESQDVARATGTSWSGCRLGFDLGASDYKIAAVQEGKVVFQAEHPWDPRHASDPSYHFGKLDKALRQAAEHLPRVDCIGGSTAGVVVDNRMRFASLFRGIPEDRFEEAQDLFQKLERTWGIPVEVANDGDVTALAAYLADGQTAVLGLAMGSSEAVGYLNREGTLTGRLNELAFAPVDLSPEAPADEWSGDTGVGAMYFSQQAAARLAAHFGIRYPETQPLPERLVDIQARMASGDPAARAIYETIGNHLGHSMAWYREFYDYDRLLLLGRVTTGAGGDIIVQSARAALETDYPETAKDLVLTMPDEKAKRLGQAVAAAALARS